MQIKSKLKKFMAISNIWSWLIATLISSLHSWSKWHTKVSLMSVLEFREMLWRFRPIFFNKPLLQPKTQRTRHLTEIFCSTRKKTTFMNKSDCWQSMVREWHLKPEEQNLISLRRTLSKFWIWTKKHKQQKESKLRGNSLKNVNTKLKLDLQMNSILMEEIKTIGFQKELIMQQKCLL